jgi:hypothetical protein
VKRRDVVFHRHARGRILRIFYGGQDHERALRGMTEE